MNKRDFLLEKSNNLIKWIENDKLVANDHPLLVFLRKCIQNFDNMLVFIGSVEKVTDQDGNIKRESLDTLLKMFCLSVDDFKDEHIDKLNRYFKCFVKVARY